MRRKPLSRRDFLRLLAVGGSALALNEFLAACGLEEATALPTGTLTDIPTLVSTITNTSQPPTGTHADQSTDVPANTATPEPTATDTPVPLPDLVVVHNGEPEQLVRKAIAAIGGMEKFVPKGANVIIKPNICVSYRTYEYAATTNPWVVGTLVKMSYEAGAGKVRVMDHTWRREMWEAYAKSGIQKQVEEAGGEMVFMYDEKFIPTELPGGMDLKSMNIYDEILNADVLINVPIAKHHADAKLTLGMKNFLGVIQNRPAIHLNMGQRIADLNSRVRATITVMDAVRMLMAWGPTGGALSDVKQMDTVIVSQDVVAVDSYTSTLFNMQPSDLDYVVAATQMGLGYSNLSELRIEEFNLQ